MVIHLDGKIIISNNSERLKQKESHNNPTIYSLYSYHKNISNVEDKSKFSIDNFS